MESKKLQQLQQANSHLAPQPMPQKKAPSSFHPATGDYRPPHSPVFQSHAQYHNVGPNYSQINAPTIQQQHQSPSNASQSTAISAATQGHTFVKSPQNLYHHQQVTGQYGPEQIYQSPQERTYQVAPARSHYPNSISHNHPHPVANLQQQYQQLQQAKIQQQIQTQNEALVHQQRTFALRQQLNPPIPQSHFHIQSQSFISSPSMQSQLQQPISQAPHRSIPPTTLNLSSQCQPAPGPIKLNNLDIRTQHYHQDPQSLLGMQTNKLQSQVLYQQSQEVDQRLYQEKLETVTPSDQGPVYIHQNHPGHVVNQACQTQISGAIGKTKIPNEEQKSPSHPVLDRKKSLGTIQALKSPLTKRPASSPVTLSGWLYKQGSDGLKVWRKRWFVLSEYCLYYYKGPEEEKLLGSILLPSYKVAACSPEDKIYRKYAFKCEHTNMRTYWLAAENAEQMCQWVRALSAATLMQASSESDQASQPSVSSLNQSGENSDSGIHTFQSQQSKLSIPQGPVTPASDSGGATQPLYANAPPKPKRVNDGGYSSPSPENSIDRCETNAEARRHAASQQRQVSNIQQPMLSVQQKGQHHAIYDARTGCVTSTVRHPTPADSLTAQFQQITVDRNMMASGTYPQHKSPYHMQPSQRNAPGSAYQQGMDIDEHIIRAPQRFNDDLGNDIYGERELYMSRPAQQKYPNIPTHLIPASGMPYPNAERRTPDAYGRSKSGQPRIFSDYEDIYNLAQSKIHQNPSEVGAYRRPMSPPTYNNEKHIPPMPSRYAPSHLEANAQQLNLRAKPLQTSGIMRPHSADFLEYEARAEAASIKSDPVRAPRPKSSLEINRTPDSFYYSEASYAEKMRQSALYLQTPQNQQTHNLSGYKSQDLSPYSGGANTIGYETTYDRAKRTETLPESINLGASSVPRVNRHIQKDYGSIQNEQFLRTASARLPRKDEDAIKDGERKREESMKRLLEWKQRMLQSPLTRKSTQQGSPTISKVASTPNVLSPHGIQRSRSETHANAGYNSYSSDDEDGPESSPAGRSSPTPSSSNAIDTSVNIISSPSQRKSPSDINLNNSLNTSLLENTSYVPVYTQKTLQTKALSTKIFDSNVLDEKTQRNVPIKDKEEIDDLETNSIKSLVHENAVICDEENDEKKNIINDVVEEQHNRDEEEPEIESDEQTCEYTDDDLEEALGETDGSLYSYYKSETNEQLYENEPSTPVMTSVGPENHYLPMTPKRSILSPTNSCAQLNSKEDSEENPYVEMTKGIEENDTKENYEIVCISANFPSNPEPVYMELTHGKIKIDEKVREENGKSTLKKSALKKVDLSKKKVKKNSDRIAKRKDLPDILKASESSVLNSESSDADDESSKEIESIKMRSRSRFSLSDTFRPASYYLGAGTLLTNCIESSDSEIVSPPPIPLSPPPLDELNTEEIFSSENYDTVKRKDKLNLSFDQIPKIHSSSSSLNLNKSEGHKSSRLSLPDQFTKLRNFKPNILKHHERTLSDSNYSFHTDNSSNTSSDFDLYNKLKNNSPSFVGSQYQSNSSLPQKLPVTDSSETDSVEFRHRQGSDSELDRQRSRRPLSEESVSEIESMSEQFEETLSNTDLDSYLSRLQTSDLYLYQNTDKTWINDGITNFIKPPEIFRNEGDEHFYGNINFVSSTDSIQKLGNDVDSILLRKESNAIQNTIQQIPSLLKEKNLSLHDAQCESEDLNAIENVNLNVVEIAKSVTMSSIDMDQTSFCTAYDLTQTTPVHSRNNSNISDQSAPYYYSDLVSRDISTNITQTLNNQRDVNLKRAGISHIHNPISSRNLVNDNNTTSLSNTRSLSAEILNATDKDQSLNNKNLYKTKDNVEKTVFKELNYKNFKHGGNSGLATSSTNILTPPIIKITNYSPTSSKVPNVDSIIENESSSNNDSKLSELTAGERLWEEDVLWRESLRRVSQRHARSLDDLDRILGPHTASVLNSENNTKENDNDKQTRIKISRDVTYVNDTVSQQLRAAYRPRLSDPPLINHKSAQWTDYKDENDVYVQLAMDDKSDVYETLREDTASNYSRKSIEIDREVIRQWDSMSSGLMKNAGGISKTEKINDIGSGAFNTSISVRNVRNIPKVNLTVKPEASDSHPLDSSNKANQIVATLDNKQAIDRTYYSTNNRINVHNSYDKENYFPLKKSGSRAEIDILERETSSQIRNLDMSAGDLLSRTHEELVLLLIQLRRQNSMTARAIEQCCTEIHELQNRIRTSDGPTRSDSIQRLNYLKQHLMDLEKQYEKSKPLVNLVDNMVKLGSLYRNNENTRHVQSESVTLDRLEFNQRVQERRLLQEEQKHWDRLSPNHTELQSKVRQLYQLDQLLQEESGTLQNLQRDKEDLERALGGLRARLQDTNGHPLALEAAKKQQHVLERELSRVHQLLAENSKKLEQTVAGNARLEQELLILRQKLQASKGSRGSQGALGGNQSAGDSIQYASSTTALLESELRRVQQLVGDMQRQRQELSQAVRQLTENSNALYQEIGNNDHSLNVPSSHIKKRQHSSCWTETDLDSMISTDHTGSSSMENLNLNTPLFIDTNSANSTSSLINCSGSSKINEFDSKNARFSDFEGNESGGIDDDLIESSFANLSNQEKQEIKTVRIVKRESERRHRDRERSSANTTVSIQNLDQVLEEEALNQITEDLYSRSKSLPRTYNETYEMFKQTKDKKLHEPQKSSQLINSNGTISSPTIPLRYNDYFSNTSNPYLVSMSDKNSNLSSYSNLSNKDKIRTLNYLANNSEQPFILRNKTESIQSLTSPVFQSEAARQIISEMSGSASEDNNEKVPQSHKHKRAVPKEKRRHYTAPNNVNTKAMQNMQAENDMNCNNTNWRARDDLDMEVALRPRMNAPDVVRSALGHREKISENTIDKLLAAPSKILIPERYIPEKTPELSPEEKKRRQEKVEAIKKMLSEAPINSANDAVSIPPSKINAEKKQREHLLQLNQILAQQVMQMSKIVAEKAMAALPSKIAELSATTSEEDRSSPTDSLPIYQQRENFFT